MGRTIPSFRIATVLEEKDWKSFRNCLNKKDKKIFKEMFSVTNLYNSACSYASNPIRIFPIMMSIAFHNYKALKNNVANNFSNSELYNATTTNDISNSTILKEELEKWDKFCIILRKQNGDLFKEMLESSYKYSSSISAKGKEYSTESLMMSLIFEQYKIQSYLS
jgi:hypothetical protein